MTATPKAITEFRNLLTDAILLSATKVLEKQLCCHCLGRMFGRLGHGLSNPERSALIREKLASKKQASGSKPPSSDSDCWVCEGLLDEIPQFASLAVDKLAGLDFSTFLIGSRVDGEICAREETLWADAGLDIAEMVKSEVNREVGKLVSEKMGKDVNLERPDVAVTIDTRYDNVTIQISPLFFYGRYKKLSREIPQTRWPCRNCRGKGCKECDNTGKRYQTSVEEQVARPLMEAAKGEEHAFHGMGREDIDARMLGNGRPFVVEITSPRIRTLDLEAAQEKINEHSKGLVEILELRPSSRREVVAIKDATHSKSYMVEIAFSEPVDGKKLKDGIAALNGKVLNQRTPNRVSHRRADKVRMRKILDLKLESVDANNAVVTVTAESGTYIKEFITGDGGRTVPSLSSLVGECKVTRLDVTKIHDDS